MKLFNNFHIEFTADMTPKEREGYELAKGAMRYVCFLISIFVMLLCLFSIIRLWLGIGMDSTDKDKWNRSGLTLYTDHLTGVKYLSDGNGGLVRREYE